MRSQSLSVKTAKNPIDNPEIIKVPAGTDQVMCNGGHPSLGHPAVYYTFATGVDVIECGYCDRRFIRQKI